MTSPFSAPSTGGEVVPPRDLVGHLLIVRPLSVETVNTQAFGAKEAVRVNVAVLTMKNLDGSHGVRHDDVLWFSGRIIGALKRQLGDLVLARMAQGTGKPGQNPPFELVSAVEDADAVAFATQWLTQHPDFQTALKAPQPAAQAAPAPAAVPVPSAAAVAAPAPVAAPVAAAPAVPTVPQVPAVPAAAVQPAAPTVPQIDPAVLAQLGPEAIAQLQQLAAAQQTG